MTASCKGDIWSDTDMLHYRCDVCSIQVTSSALITASFFFFSSLPASPLPNARAVCHGWFGNKMRKVLSQRQKSPFHLALCHPFPLSHAYTTHANTHMHVRTSEPTQSFSENLLHTCISLRSLRGPWFCLHTSAGLHAWRRVQSHTYIFYYPPCSFILLWMHEFTVEHLGYIFVIY